MNNPIRVTKSAVFANCAGLFKKCSTKFARDRTGRLLKSLSAWLSQQLRLGFCAVLILMSPKRLGLMACEKGGCRTQKRA